MTNRKKYAKAYYEKNKEIILAKQREHYKNNKVEIAAKHKIYRKKYYQNNKEKFKMKRLEYSRKIRALSKLSLSERRERISKKYKAQKEQEELGHET